MKAVRFHPEAQAELIDAAAWYETQQAGLGRRFLASIQDAVNRVQSNPQLYAAVDGDVRRCLAQTFPYGLLFRIGTKTIDVLAVMHLHREPGYWRNR